MRRSVCSGQLLHAFVFAIENRWQEKTNSSATAVPEEFTPSALQQWRREILPARKKIVKRRAPSRLLHQRAGRGGGKRRRPLLPRYPRQRPWPWLPTGSPPNLAAVRSAFSGAASVIVTRHSSQKARSVTLRLEFHGEIGRGPREAFRLRHRKKKKPASEATGSRRGAG